MAGFLDEAARLADLVARDQLTQDEAEQIFWGYIQDLGVSITEIGARSMVADPRFPGSGDCARPARRWERG